MKAKLTQKVKCPYCGHEWLPRKEHIIKCPWCQKGLDEKKKKVKIYVDRK